LAFLLYVNLSDKIQLSKGIMMNGPEIRAVLAQNIKSFRIHRDWSQADLAERAEISIPFLSDIERGNKWPYPDTLSKLAEALKVEIYELFRKESPLTNENRDYTARIVKEILIAQKEAAEAVYKQYLG
jgi:transcriptional regulator with XRE-family HTH domain